jgi:hypothetical protein
MYHMCVQLLEMQTKMKMNSYLKYSSHVNISIMKNELNEKCMN